MLRSVTRGFARLIGAPLPEYPDGVPMSDEEYDEIMRAVEEQKLRLDDELSWATMWEEDDRRREGD